MVAYIKPIYMILQYLIEIKCTTIATMKLIFHIFKKFEVMNSKICEKKNHLNLMKKSVKVILLDYVILLLVFLTNS